MSVRTKTNATLVSITLLALFVQVSGQANKEVDRTFDGLNGNVKTVSREVVDFGYDRNGKRVENARVPILRTAYDEAGNQTRVEEYDDKGNLSLIMEYGFIGRQRVVKNTAPESSTALMVAVPTPKGRKNDSRYTHRFVYQYDAEGRRTQTLVYLSSGELWLKHVFRFAANRKIHFVYSHGRLSQKLEYTFDERGNEISVTIDAKFVSSNKTVYKCDDFDSQGNWTKRTVYKGFKELSDAEFSRLEPWAIEYRVITYY